MRATMLLALLAAALALAVPAAARADDSSQGCGAAECYDGTPVVPSFDPEWSANFVPPALPETRAATACIPTDIVVYAPTDWVRFAQRMRLNMSPCATYYVSIPPLANNKIQPRGPLQAPQIRALGPNFHAVNEVNVTDATSWKDWVTGAAGRTWYDAGVEARRRMDDPAQGNFDPASGDIWAVNEMSKAVRQGAGTSRENMRDFVHGLYDGTGGPPVKGIVWVSNFGQGTTFFDTYRGYLKSWLGDAAWWADMSQYVRFYSQEVYGRFDKWAVPGTTPTERLGPTADYLEHAANFAAAGTYDTGADVAAPYLATTDAPIGNAAWSNGSYEWPSPAVDYVLAANYDAAQVYAFRNAQRARESQSFGFAWAPTNPGLTKADFDAKTAFILDRIAAAIHASDQPSSEPGLAACGVDLSWCTGDFAGATFNTAWQMFHDWTQPTAIQPDKAAVVQADTPTSIPLAATDLDPDQQLTYSIVGQPAHGSATTDGSASASYVPAPGYHGPDSFSFRVSDGLMSSNVATVALDVNAPPVVTLDPAGPLDEGAAPIALAAHASDPDGSPVTLTWSTDAGTLVPSGDTATFAADDGPATAHVTVTADDGKGGTATAKTDVVVRNVPPVADAGADASAVWGVPVTFTGTASDPSPVDTKAGPTATWAFGDGSAAAGLHVSHVYTDPGRYTATLTVTDKDGGVGTDSVTVTVGPRPASLVSTTAATANAAATIVRVRLDDGSDSSSARLGGHSVALTIGSTSCSAPTDGSGVAQCALDGASLPLGPANVTARFDGDPLYKSVSTSAPILLYRVPAGGMFAVGDRSASGAVTFWSPSWSHVNSLSGGTAPASFKGFVQPGPNGWTASPGFDHAPAAVPEWMGVLVTTSVSKDGAVIAGDRPRMVVVHVDTYDPVLIGGGTVLDAAS